MTREATLIELHEIQLPELAGLVQEVRRTRIPVVLRENGHDVAILSPAPAGRRAGKRVRQSDINAALATFGTWKDLDAERLIRELDEARSDTSSPVEL